jgi:death-on-curing protein
MTFGGEDLYPTLLEKAAALGFSLIMNHPFVDGNKRIGHAALETFLLLNGMEIKASVDEQEATILSLAAGELDRSHFLEWLRSRLVTRRLD